MYLCMINIPQDVTDNSLLAEFCTAPYSHFDKYRGHKVFPIMFYERSCV